MKIVDPIIKKRRSEPYQQEINFIVNQFNKGVIPTTVIRPARGHLFPVSIPKKPMPYSSLAASEMFDFTIQARS